MEVFGTTSLLDIMYGGDKEITSSFSYSKIKQETSSPRKQNDNVVKHIVQNSEEQLWVEAS